MKRLAKAMLKGVWRAAGPIRRPVTRRCETFLKECVRPAEPVNLMHVVEESNVLLDQVVRELVRLQRQTEYLQQMTEQLSAARNSRSDPEEGPPTWDTVAHRQAG